MDNETPKTVTGSKLVITAILFIGLGLLLNSLLTYNQVTGTHTTIEGRVEVGGMRYSNSLKTRLNKSKFCLTQ